MNERTVDHLRTNETLITWIDGAIVLALTFLGYSRLTSGDFDLLGVAALAAAGAVFFFDQYRYNWTLDLKTPPKELKKTVSQLALALVAVAVTYWIYRKH